MVPVTLARLTAALLALASSACGPSGAAGPDGVFCAGASAEQAARPDHPALLRGTVWAPAPLDFALPPLAAGALPGEASAPAGVPIVIARLDEPDRVPIAVTTDAAGRFCARVDDWSSPWLIRAELGTGVRRAIATHARAGSVGGASEAIVRVAEASGPLGGRAPQQWLNIETVSVSALGLLRPEAPPEAGADALAWAIEALERDERVARAVGAAARPVRGAR